MSHRGMDRHADFDKEYEARGGRKHRTPESIDEEEEEEEEGEDDFTVEGGADLRDEDDGRRMRSSHMPLHDQEDREAVGRSIQERYGRRPTDYDDEATDVEQQALLPSVRDPKLWMVCCVNGREREMAVCLMQKYIDKGSELQIRSAIALDHLDKYIFVEADTEAHVREACKGLSAIFARRILPLPISKMTDVLSFDIKAMDLAIDTWVRIESGTYAGDPAQVVDVDNVRKTFTVKVIPRIDLQALANKLEGRAVVAEKPYFRPPRRFMKVDEARELGIPVEPRLDAYGERFDAIEGAMFKDGLLYTTVSVKNTSFSRILGNDLMPTEA